MWESKKTTYIDVTQWGGSWGNASKKGRLYNRERFVYQKGTQFFVKKADSTGRLSFSPKERLRL